MVLLEQTTCKHLSVPNMAIFRHYFLRDIFCIHMKTLDFQIISKRKPNRQCKYFRLHTKINALIIDRQAKSIDILKIFS